jgi:hypothetical protein
VTDVNDPSIVARTLIVLLLDRIDEEIRTILPYSRPAFIFYN